MGPWDCRLSVGSRQSLIVARARPRVSVTPPEISARLALPRVGMSGLRQRRGAGAERGGGGGAAAGTAGTAQGSTANSHSKTAANPATGSGPRTHPRTTLGMSPTSALAHDVSESEELGTDTPAKPS